MFYLTNCFCIFSFFHEVKTRVRISTRFKMPFSVLSAICKLHYLWTSFRNAIIISSASKHTSIPFYVYHTPLLWYCMCVSHFRFLITLRFIIPPKRSLGGYIGVTRWLVGRSVGRSVGQAVRCIFLVWSITWRLMVEIQYNFIQWSRALIGSAVHKNHNSILTNYRIIALCYFSLSGA
jgi:hypothetical protein